MPKLHRVWAIALLSLLCVPAAFAVTPKKSARRTPARGSAAAGPAGSHPAAVPDTLVWYPVEVDSTPFRVRLPAGWVPAQHADYLHHHIVVPPLHSHEDSLQSRDFVGVAVQLFREGARFVAGEMGPTLQPQQAPIMVWLEKLDVAPGQMGEARQKVIYDMEGLTMGPVWDSVIVQNDHPLVWLESHRPAVKNDTLNLPPIRIVSNIYDEPSGMYRWSSTFVEDRPGALDLVYRLFQRVELR